MGSAACELRKNVRFTQRDLNELSLREVVSQDTTMVRHHLPSVLSDVVCALTFWFRFSIFSLSRSVMVGRLPKGVCGGHQSGATVVE